MYISTIEATSSTFQRKGRSNQKKMNSQDSVTKIALHLDDNKQYHLEVKRVIEAMKPLVTHCIFYTRMSVAIGEENGSSNNMSVLSFRWNYYHLFGHFANVCPCLKTWAQMMHQKDPITLAILPWACIQEKAKRLGSEHAEIPSFIDLYSTCEGRDDYAAILDSGNYSCIICEIRGCMSKPSFMDGTFSFSTEDLHRLRDRVHMDMHVDRMLAFVMALHKRLGQNSSAARHLDDGVAWMIWKMVCAPMPKNDLGWLNRVDELESI